MATNPFPEWLAEVAADAVLVRPGDPDAEARGNAWSFALSPEQAAAVSVADAVAFAAGVADGRRAWLAAHAAGPMTLYWWHDEQAGLLRFGLVSAPGALPFGCAVAPAASLAAVVSEWLNSPTLHGIPWGDLGPPGDDDEPTPAFTLSVWTLQVP